MNKFFITGNLTDAPDLRITTSGHPVCKFTVAVSRKFKDAEGAKVTDFFNVIAWRGLADNCAKYLTKGKKVAVVGQVQNRSYDDAEGKKRYITEVIADDVEFLSPIQNDGNHQNQVETPSNPMDGYTEVDEDAPPF